ncbi:MAG: SGNH/GDSL hydrolase family protein [Phycisphaerae bacterium]
MAGYHADADATCAPSTNRMPFRRLKTLKTLLVTALLLGGAELSVRARAWYRHGAAGPVANIYEEDPVLGRRIRAGAVLAGHRRNLSVNRWGFRGPDIPLEKPPGTIRIATLGESTTFGLEARDNESVWPARLWQQLARNRPSLRFDFINAAVPGYTIDRCARVLYDRVTDFKPDIITILAATADITAQCRKQFARSTTHGESAAWPSRLFHDHSLLYNLLRVNTAGVRSELTPQHRDRRLEQRGVDHFAETLDQMVRFASRRGIHVVLCTYPRSFGDPTAPTPQATLGQSALANNPALTLAGLNDAYDRYNEAIRTVAARHTVTLVDLDRLIPRRKTYFHDAIHFSDSGHQLVAQVIARTLNPALPGGKMARGDR